MHACSVISLRVNLIQIFNIRSKRRQHENEIVQTISGPPCTMCDHSEFVGHAYFNTVHRSLKLSGQSEVSPSATRSMHFFVAFRQS